jgi:hypothetical protein
MANKNMFGEMLAETGRKEGADLGQHWVSAGLFPEI